LLRHRLDMMMPSFSASCHINMLCKVVSRRKTPCGAPSICLRSLGKRIGRHPDGVRAPHK
jgi:hypothetical protein